MQAPQGFAQPLLRRGNSEFALLPELCHHGVDVCSAKTQLAQSRRHLRGDIERAGVRRWRVAVHQHAERARQYAKVAGIACAAQLAPV